MSGNKTVISDIVVIISIPLFRSVVDTSTYPNFIISQFLNTVLGGTQNIVLGKKFYDWNNVRTEIRI
jgi:hypothetical protein